ncbi:MAG: glycosyltransferase family 39 protein [Clostridia bacterium]|nr:glycosyltransferase family 39 protein [Clostridia bacterium]
MDYVSKAIGFIKEYRRYIIIAIFAVFYISGVCSINSYGVNYDIRSEENILMTNLKDYAKDFLPEKAQQISAFRNLPDIQNYKERDHGKAAFYPLGVFKLTFSPALYNYYFLYSLYTFTINFAGLIFLYLLAKLIFRRRVFALITAAFYTLCPRIYADFFYNDKDMIFCSFVIITAYFALCFILKENHKYLYAVLTGVFAAFACNTRVIGLFLPFLILSYYIYTIFRDKKANNKEVYLPVISALAAFAAVFIIITPATWYGIIEYFKYTLSSSADFTRWNGTVYYLNKFYPASDGLPWHYLPVMMLCTISPFVTLGAAAGIGVLIYRLAKKKTDKHEKLLTIFIISSFVPLLFAIIGGSRVYNGWRHFYFVYPAICLLAVYAVIQFLNKKKDITKYVTAAAVAFSLLITVTSAPHGYAYYNFASKSFEGDYWNISARECLEQLLLTTDGQIKITYSDKHSAAGVENSAMYLGPKYRDRITVTENPQDADYIFVNPTYYDIARFCDEIFTDVSNPEKCAEVKLGNRTLTAVYSLKNVK